MAARALARRFEPFAQFEPGLRGAPIGQHHAGALVEVHHHRRHLVDDRLQQLLVLRHLGVGFAARLQRAPQRAHILQAHDEAGMPQHAGGGRQRGHGAAHRRMGGTLRHHVEFVRQHVAAAGAARDLERIDRLPGARTMELRDAAERLAEPALVEVEQHLGALVVVLERAVFVGDEHGIGDVVEDARITFALRGDQFGGAPQGAGDARRQQAGAEHQHEGGDIGGLPRALAAAQPRKRQQQEADDAGGGGRQDAADPGRHDDGDQIQRRRDRRAQFLRQQQADREGRGQHHAGIEEGGRRRALVEDAAFEEAVVRHDASPNRAKSAQPAVSRPSRCDRRRFPDRWRTRADRATTAAR